MRPSENAFCWAGTTTNVLGGKLFQLLHVFGGCQRQENKSGKLVNSGNVYMLVIDGRITYMFTSTVYIGLVRSPNPSCELGNLTNIGYRSLAGGPLGLLTSSFTPFARSGRVTHATVIG